MIDTYAEHTYRVLMGERDDARLNATYWRNKYEAKCNPQTVNLDTVSDFTFSVEGGTFIGDVQMLKWLVEHHSREYWAHMAKRNEEGAR